LQQLQAQMSPAAVDLQTVQGTFHWLTDRMQVEGIRVQTAQTLVTATGVLPGSQHRQCGTARTTSGRHGNWSAVTG
jgi:hypothetical protein